MFAIWTNLFRFCSTFVPKSAKHLLSVSESRLAKYVVKNNRLCDKSIPANFDFLVDNVELVSSSFILLIWTDFSCLFQDAVMDNLPH